MATMIPNTLFDTNSEGEKRIFEALRYLPDSYRVIHSLRWINSRRSRSQGEADFVIYHPDKGIMVIEVKAGLLRCENRKWYQKNRNTGQEFEIFDPEKQADESKFKIIELLEMSNCLVCHTVWFPSISVENISLPPNYHPDMLFDEVALHQPLEFINNAFKYWSKQTGRETNLDVLDRRMVMEKLAPNFSLFPSPKVAHQNAEQLFHQFTLEQAKVLDFLELQREATIAGSAGTGKTIIAIEKAKRLHQNGRKVVFLCYNRLLANYLNILYGYLGFKIVTFHELLSELISSISNNEYRNLERFFNENLDDITFPYTDLIIDEGQDFSTEWIDNLQLLLPRRDGITYIFHDNQQDLYGRGLGWFDNSPCRLILSKNCRNTKAIAKTAYGIIGLKRQTILSPIEGDKTKILRQKEIVSQVQEINQIIREYINQTDVRPYQIALITMHDFGYNKSLLKEYTEHFNFQYLVDNLEEDKVVVTTARKYKGLEGALVIITDLDWGKLAEKPYRNRFYMACSRAKNKLYIVSKPTDELDIKSIIKNIMGQERPKAGKRKFLELLNLEEQC